jgi:hypothetical protein
VPSAANKSDNKKGSTATILNRMAEKAKDGHGIGNAVLIALTARQRYPISSLYESICLSSSNCWQLKQQ